MLQFIYTALLYPCLLLAFLVLSFFNKKIAEGFRIRLVSQPLKPTIQKYFWFHVASGEFEYAKPVIRELKRKTNGLILVTYFSPSVKKSIEVFPEVDLAIPMPWDTPWHWNSFIKTYQPRVLAIARTDLWPNMIWQSHKKNIPIILFSATLPSHSARVASFWGRLFYSFILENLSLISCVTEEDKANFLKIHSELRVQADGDTRFDQTLYRLSKESARPQVEEIKLKIKNHFANEERIFLAGSTWPEDESVLVPAVKKFLENPHSPMKFIFAPHEVTSEYLKKLQSLLSFNSLSSIILSDLLNAQKSSPYVTQKILIIDQVGILADLYTLADLAFVGGSFKKSVHSVMEPAAAGCFTLVGPFHYNNREALKLKSEGYLKECNSPADFASEFKKYAELNSQELQEKKSTIQNFIKSLSGVSKKISALLEGV